MPHVKHGLGWPRIAQLAITQKTINQYYRRTDSSHRSQALFFMGHFALQPLLKGTRTYRVFLSLCGRLIHSFARHTCIHKLGPIFSFNVWRGLLSPCCPFLVFSLVLVVLDSQVFILVSYEIVASLSFFKSNSG